MDKGGDSVAVVILLFTVVDPLTLLQMETELLALWRLQTYALDTGYSPKICACDTFTVYIESVYIFNFFKKDFIY